MSLPFGAGSVSFRCYPNEGLDAAETIAELRAQATLACAHGFDGVMTSELVDAFRGAGGTGPCVLVRRAWLGEPPRSDVDRQLDVYRGYAPSSAPAHWGSDEMVVGPDAVGVAHGLAPARERAGVDALNLRVHVPDVTPAAAREQIVRLGDEVLPLLRTSG